jgi:hypothetical protein
VPVPQNVEHLGEVIAWDLAAAVAAEEPVLEAEVVAVAVAAEAAEAVAAEEPVLEAEVVVQVPEVAAVEAVVEKIYDVPLVFKLSA